MTAPREAIARRVLGYIMGYSGRARKIEKMADDWMAIGKEEEEELS